MFTLLELQEELTTHQSDRFIPKLYVWDVSCHFL